MSSVEWEPDWSFAQMNEWMNEWTDCDHVLNAPIQRNDDWLKLLWRGAEPFHLCEMDWSSAEFVGHF